MPCVTYFPVSYKNDSIHKNASIIAMLTTINDVTDKKCFKIASLADALVIYYCITTYTKTC